MPRLRPGVESLEQSSKFITSEQSDIDPGPNWTEPDFDDASWPTGPALLYQESDQLNGPAGTLLELNPPTTHYFRHTFNYEGDPTRAALEFEIFALRSPRITSHTVRERSEATMASLRPSSENAASTAMDLPRKESTLGSGLASSSL